MSRSTQPGCGACARPRELHWKCKLTPIPQRVTRRPLYTPIALLLLGGLLLVVPARAQQTVPPGDYDIVIRNGRVLDGAGNPWILADVAIKDGRFAAIGRVTSRGTTEIDARGKYVSPGWIDMMDQSIAMVARNPLAENKLMMGVTSAIAGEGGPPVRADSLAGYFRRLESQGISINIGRYYNEGQARSAVLGMVARAPNAEELTRMQAILETAMRAVLTLPEAIRKMTSWPATRMRLADRGLIRENAWADVVVFDLDTLADRAT